MHVQLATERVLPRSRVHDFRRRILADSLYRNSLLLIANSALLAGFGMAFWTLASRSVSAQHIGQATAITSFTMFAASAVTLGMPNLVMKTVNVSTNPRAFVTVCCSVIIAFAGFVAAVWIALGGHVGSALRDLHTGPMLWMLVTLAVVVPAVSNVVDSAIIAKRESQYVLIKNVCGSVSKLLALPLLAAAGAKGLFGAYVISALVATTVAAVLLGRSWGNPRVAPAALLPSGRGADAALSELLVLRGHVRFALGNHVGVLVAMLPISTLPLIVVTQLGATKAAYVTIPMMIVALMNVVPSMTSQSMFAELASGAHETATIRKAVRASYSMLLPILVLVWVGAPVVLRVFGSGYSATGTPVLRWLSIAALFGCANYIADTVLIARGRVAAYSALNVAGTISAMLFPIIGLQFGASGFGVGWLIGQVGYSLSAWIALRSQRPKRVAT